MMVEFRGLEPTPRRVDPGPKSRFGATARMAPPAVRSAIDRVGLGAAVLALACSWLAPDAHALQSERLPAVEILIDTDPPGPSGWLTLEKGRVRNAIGRDNGSLRMSGVFDVRDQAGTFADRVLGNASSMQIRDGGAFSANLRFVGCERRRRGIHCRSRDRTTRVSFRATDLANVFKMTVASRNLPSTVTGESQPRGPISAVFSDGSGNDRPDILSDCERSGRNAIRCKH